jgi:YidC/Oxa1 family membrane protein insertase
MDTRRLVLFVVFSFSIMMLWDAWQVKDAPQGVAIDAAGSTTVVDASIPSPSSVPASSGAVDTGKFKLLKGDLIKVATDLYEADISTLGGDIRHLTLNKHLADGKQAGNFVLMDEAVDPVLYVAQSGLIGVGLPNHKTQFTSTATSYTMASDASTLDVTLSWTNNGIKVDKVYTFHRGSYEIEVAHHINNASATEISPSVYYQLTHDSESNQGSAFMPTFTGGAYYTKENNFKKISFADMADANLSLKSKDGWIGIIQHYFASAWIPKAGVSNEFYTKQLSDEIYAVGVVNPVGAVAAGSTADVKAQTASDLEAAAPGLEFAVDYGWLTVIAKPLFWMLTKIHSLIGNWGVAIIVLTIMIKALFFKLSAASYRSMAHMREMAPRMQSLKEKFGDDKQKLQQAMMEMYKTEKVAYQFLYKYLFLLHFIGCCLVL